MTGQESIAAVQLPAPFLPDAQGAFAPPALEGEIVAVEETLSPSAQALMSVLDRLEQSLDSETSALRTLRSADFVRLNEIKSRLLLDTSRAVRGIENESIGGRLVARLSTVRLKLEHNRLAVAMHLDAVREIAAAMSATLIDAESDGTYSARMPAATSAA